MRRWERWGRCDKEIGKLEKVRAEDRVGGEGVLRNQGMWGK